MHGHVIVVVTDTCAQMKKAWTYVIDEFPWISAIPCVPHVASLLLKDVAKIPEVSTLIQQESTVVGWFSNHQKPLAILREKARQQFGKRRELVKAGETRFGTHTLVGERLLSLQTALQQTIYDPDYVKENYKDGLDSVEHSNCEKHIRSNRGGTAKKLVTDDEPDGFWARVKTHVSATMPTLKLLRRHDSSAPSVGKVYHGFFEVGEGIQNSDAPYKEEMSKSHAERWDYGDADFFRAAYAVDPEFQDCDLSDNSEIMQGFLDTAEKIAILTEVRRLQQLDGRHERSMHSSTLHTLPLCVLKAHRTSSVALCTGSLRYGRSGPS